MSVTPNDWANLAAINSKIAKSTKSGTLKKATRAAARSYRYRAKKAYKSWAKKVLTTGTGNNSVMTGPRSNPFRVKKFISMQYNRSTQLCSSGVGVNRLGAVYVYSLNNLNKPSTTQLTGDPLPYGFGDAASDWKSFKVHGCYIKLSIPPNVVGKHMKLLVSFVNSSGGGTPLTIGTDYETFIGLPNVYVMTLDMDNPTVFKKKIGIARLEGLTKSQFKNNIDVKYRGNYNKNSAVVTDDPKSAVYMYVGLVNTFDNTAQCYEKDLQITYYTENLDKLNSVKEAST